MKIERIRNITTYTDTLRTTPKWDILRKKCIQNAVLVILAELPQLSRNRKDGLGPLFLKHFFFLVSC